LLLSPFATKTFSQPPDPSQIPEPQIAYALHATWDPDLTDNNPSICTNSGTVAVPWFHFYAGWKDGAPAFFSVDWVLIQELTSDHEPQVWLFTPQGESGFPYGCTMPPVSDPENWNWTTWSFAPMLGFAMHNTAYRVTVQWRYGVYMKGPRGPFQTSITINVQNLVVSSPDETKVLKWDPVRGIAETSFGYSLECAQRKWCQVKISIYTTDGMKVYEEWLEQIAPGSYSFVWDGSVNVMPPPPPPDGLAPAGLYVFDIDVIGIAPGYDEDWLRSGALQIGEHEIFLLGYSPEEQPHFRAKTSWSTPALAQYILYGNYQASKVILEIYDSNFQRLLVKEGPTYTIPFNATPTESDVNEIKFFVSLEGFVGEIPYTFVFWGWDGAAHFYKNHKPKTTFTNDKEKGVTHAHFVASSSDNKRGVEGGLAWFKKEVKPFLKEIWYSQKILFGLIEKWRICPLSPKYIHWHGSEEKVDMDAFQEWNPNNILDAISHVEFLSLIAHGYYDGYAMGKLKWTGELVDELTASEIYNRYKGTWYWWDYSTRKSYPMQGLGHLRAVLLMGCKTGGDKHPYEGDPNKKEKTMIAEPQPGTIAEAFWILCAKVVIFSTTDAWSPVAKDFVKLFYKYAQKKTIIEAAQAARNEVIMKVRGTGDLRYVETAYNILMAVKSDAKRLRLAP